MRTRASRRVGFILVMIVALALPLAPGSMADHKGDPHGGGGGGGGGDSDGGGGGSVNFAIEAYDTVSDSYTRGNVVQYAEGQDIPYRLLLDAPDPTTVIQSVDTVFDHRMDDVIGIETLVPLDELGFFGLCTGERLDGPPGADGCLPVAFVPEGGTPSDSDAPYVEDLGTELVSGVEQGTFRWHNIDFGALGTTAVTLVWGALLGKDDPAIGLLGASDWNGASLHHSIGDAVVDGEATSVGNKDVPIPVKQIIDGDVDKTINDLDAVVSPDDLVVGETATVQITASTSGPKRESVDVQVVDELPACLTYVSGSATVSGVNGGPDEPEIAGNQLVWNFQDVSHGTEIVITFDVTATQVASPGDCVNVAHLHVDEFEIDEHDEVPVEVRGAADVHIAKECLPTDRALVPGETGTHRLTFGNDGGATATAEGIQIVDMLDPGLEYVTGSSELGGSSIGDPSVSGDPATGQTLTYATLPDLDPAESHVLTYDVEVPASGSAGQQDLNDTATISTTTEERGNRSNSASCSTTVKFEPDLFVDKTCPSEPVPAGTPFMLTIDYGNEGTAAATQVKLVDQLPEGVTYVDDGMASPTPTSVSPDGRTLTWELGTLGANGVDDDTITFNAVSSTDGTKTNVATISSPVAESDTADNTDDCDIGVATANVFISKTCPATAGPGDLVLHTLTFGNDGNAPAENVVVTDSIDLPGGGNFDGMVSGPTPTSIASSTDTSGDVHITVTWEFGTQPAGWSDTLSYNIQIPDNADTAGTLSYTDQASISTDTTESDTTDNTSDPCITTVEFLPVLNVTKAGCPDPTVVPGGILTYDITWWVTGSAPADNVTLTDTLPAGTEFLEADPAPDGQSGQTLTWNFGDQDPTGTMATVEIDVLVTVDSGTLVNTATLSTTTPNVPDATATESTNVSTAGASTAGEAYALDIDLLGSTLIDELARVDSAAPGGPAADGMTVLPVDVPGIASAEIIGTLSQSEISGGQASSLAIAEIADLDLLSGAITADVVRGVSSSTADPFVGTADSPGATFANLEINGTQYADVAPNTTVDVKNPLPLLSDTIARAVLLEETATASPAGPPLAAGSESSATHSVNMIHVTLLKPFLTLPAGAEIIVSHAGTTATFPSGLPCDGEAPGSVSGEAFTAFAEGILNGAPVATGQIGEAVLPPTGGSDSDGTPAQVPGVVTTSTASNSTSGTLFPDPHATANSHVEDADVLGGTITATALDVTSTSDADGTTAATTFDTTFLNLVVGGTPIDVPVGPNTVVAVPDPSGDLVMVVLNEQTSAGDGAVNTAGTVNAIHAFVLNGSGGALRLEVIVASAHSDAHA